MMEKKTVTLRTLSPLFVKGKDPGYGEGMLRGNDRQIYLIDNDELCEYLAGKNKIDEYVAYYQRPMPHNDYVFFADLYGIDINQYLYECKPLPNDHNQKYRRKDDEIDGEPVNTNRFLDLLCDHYVGNRGLRPDMIRFKLFKDYSLKFFLDIQNCMPNDPDDKSLKDIAKGIMPLEESSGDEKFFIHDVDGNYYVPGSSIKGAIRNALLWSMMKGSTNSIWLNDFVHRNTSSNRIDPNKPSFRTDRDKSEIVGGDGETLERKSGFIRKWEAICDFDADYSARWEDANEQLRDVFKALKITDSPKILVDKNYKNKVIAVCIRRDATDNKYLYRKRFEVALHSIPPCVDIPFTITLDTGLLKRMYCDQLPECFKSIDNLLDVVGRFFSMVYLHERRFFDGTIPDNTTPFSNSLETQRFYNQEREKLFRLGWGCGIMTKTQFLLLNDKYNTGKVLLSLKKVIRDKYTGRKQPNHSVDAPKSRCLIKEGSETGKPLGWCELVYEKKKYQLGEVMVCSISSFETIMVGGKERCRPLTVKIEGEEKDIPVVCEKTSKNESQAKNLFSEVKIAAVDESNQITGTIPIF